MGTEKWATAMRQLFFALLAATTGAFAHADPIATDKVIQFLTRAYTDQPMRAAEWLSKDVRNSDKFNAFGGLDRLIKQSTSRAREYKGLKSVSIIDVKKEGEVYFVTAEVKFIEDHRNADSPAAAEREAMIWNVRVAREDGRWMLRL